MGRTPRPLVAAVALVVLTTVAGCGFAGDGTRSTDGPSTRASTVTGDTGSGDDGAPDASPRWFAATAEATGAAASAFVVADERVTLSVRLKDGSKARFVAPANAIDAGREITLVPVADGQALGVRIEPAGVWLKAPATLAFTSQAARAIRIGRTDDAELFGLAALDARSRVIVARLRPVLVVDDGSVLPEFDTAIAASHPASAPIGDDGIDGVDALAFSDERREQESPDGSTESGPEALGGGGAALTAPDGCRTFASTQQMAELAEMSKGSGTMEIPDCVEVRVRLVGSYDMETPEGSWSQRERGEGVTVASAAGGTASFPVTGEIEGAGRLMSLWGSQLLNGVRDFTAEVAVPWAKKLGTPSDLPDIPPVSDSYCKDGPLEGASATVTATKDDTGMLRIEVMPTPGTWAITCVSPFQDGDLPDGQWDAIRLLAGVPAGAPFVVTAPADSTSVRLWSDLQQVSSMGVRQMSDGSVTVQDSDGVYRLNASIVLFYSPATEDAGN